MTRAGEGPAWACGPAGAAMWARPRGGTALAEAGGGVERTLSGAGRTRPSAAEEGIFFFIRVSGRGRDPNTEGCIYRHRGS